MPVVEWSEVAWVFSAKPKARGTCVFLGGKVISDKVDQTAARTDRIEEAGVDQFYRHSRCRAIDTGRLGRDSFSRRSLPLLQPQIRPNMLYAKSALPEATPQKATCRQRRSPRNQMPVPMLTLAALKPQLAQVLRKKPVLKLTRMDLQPLL
ncbi:hypothetical protein PC116_g19219 [Phytophthora cactorum]|nr:hypothetical protein PC116_g19219 [Phytophthora cactorum]